MLKGLKDFFQPSEETRKANQEYFKMQLGCTDEEKYAVYDLLMFLLSLHSDEVQEARRCDFLFSQNYALIDGVYGRLDEELHSDPPEDDDDDE